MPRFQAAGSASAGVDPLPRSLAAGAVSGVVGVSVFLAVHHLWILPIWSIAPVGVPIAALMGVAVGWAAHEARERLPRRPSFLALALAALLLALLVPAELLSFRRGPFDVSDPLVPQGVLVVAFVELATAIPLGALVGWWLTRSWRGTLAWALAGLATALGVGHNVTLLGATFPAAYKMWAVMATAQLAAAATYVFAAKAPRAPSA